MLIEINLLPKKKPKNMAIVISFVLFLVILCGALGFIYYYSTTLNTEINNVKQTAHTIQVERLELEKTINDQAAASELNESDKMLMEIIDSTVQTSTLIDQMEAQLPTGATIPMYNYTDAQTMNINVEVQSADEVGLYAENLETLPWVKRAMVQSVSTQEGEDEGVSTYLGTLSLTLQPDGVIIKESGDSE